MHLKNYIQLQPFQVLKVPKVGNGKILALLVPWTPWNKTVRNTSYFRYPQKAYLKEASTGVAVDKQEKSFLDENKVHRSLQSGKIEEWYYLFSYLRVGCRRWADPCVIFQYWGNFSYFCTELCNLTAHYYLFMPLRLQQPVIRPYRGKSGKAN